jgi:SAM-dependent methyltransferase
VKISFKGKFGFFLFQVSTPIKFGQGSVHVDLGAGAIPRNPFLAEQLIATDFQLTDRFTPGHKRIQCDLTQSLPFENNSIDSFSAYDVVEHIPRWERLNGEIRFPFIDLMNEIYRCLKPDGIFIAVTPAFPHPASFQDPTHVNQISVETADYFCGDKAGARTLGYGFTGYFEKLQNNWLRGPGPFENSSWISDDVSNFIYSRKVNLKFSEIPRFLVRISRVLRKRQPSHLLWVFRKPHLSESDKWFPAP